jgi:hypothetical protein
VDAQDRRPADGDGMNHTGAGGNCLERTLAATACEAALHRKGEFCARAREGDGEPLGRGGRFEMSAMLAANACGARFRYLVTILRKGLARNASP